MQRERRPTGVRRAKWPSRSTLRAPAVAVTLASAMLGCAGPASSGLLVAQSVGEGDERERTSLAVAELSRQVDHLVDVEVDPALAAVSPRFPPGTLANTILDVAARVQHLFRDDTGRVATWSLLRRVGPPALAALTHVELRFDPSRHDPSFDARTGTLVFRVGAPRGVDVDDGLVAVVHAWLEPRFRGVTASSLPAGELEALATYLITRPGESLIRTRGPIDSLCIAYPRLSADAQQICTSDVGAPRWSRLDGAGLAHAVGYRGVLTVQPIEADKPGAGRRIIASTPDFPRVDVLVMWKQRVGPDPLQSMPLVMGRTGQLISWDDYDASRGARSELAIGALVPTDDSEDPVFVLARSPPPGSDDEQRRWMIALATAVDAMLFTPTP